MTGIVYPVLVVVVSAVVVFACLRFIVRPTTAGANLKPYTEAFSLVATLGLAIALAVSHGVVFGAP